MGVRAGEEHDVAAHHEGGADDEEDVAAVESPAEEGEEDGEKGANNIRRNGMELLRDHTIFGVDCLDDRGGEEGQTLYGDVVQEEYEGGRESDRAKDTAEDLWNVELVQDFCGTDTFGFDTSDCKVFLLLREPPRSSGTVGQGEEGDERKTAGNDALNGKDHAPMVKAAEVREL